MSDAFDVLSDSYDATYAQLPEPYVDLVAEIRRLVRTDRVVDLGCGTGRLTLPLAEKTGAITEGVDSSTRMLEIARASDVGKKVHWRHASVEDFDLGREVYALIVSFESFHLFPNMPELVVRCANGLRPGGVLAIGWQHYEWEALLEDPVVEVFDRHGLEWGEWGYQACRQFPGAAADCDLLSPVFQRSVSVHSESTVEDIATILLSVDKTMSLSAASRRLAKTDLLSAMRRFAPNGTISGDASYHLACAARLQSSS